MLAIYGIDVMEWRPCSSKSSIGIVGGRVSWARRMWLLVNHETCHWCDMTNEKCKKG